MKRKKIQLAIRNLIFGKNAAVTTNKNDFSNSHIINDDHSIEEYYKFVERPYIAIK